MSVLHRSSKPCKEEKPLRGNDKKLKMFDAYNLGDVILKHYVYFVCKRH